jgi:hypothetical protein
MAIPSHMWSSDDNADMTLNFQRSEAIFTQFIVSQQGLLMIRNKGAEDHNPPFDHAPNVEGGYLPWRTIGQVETAR